MIMFVLQNDLVLKVILQISLLSRQFCKISVPQQSVYKVNVAVKALQRALANTRDKGSHIPLPKKN